MEKLYRLGNSYQFISGFPRFLDVLIGQKPTWKAATVVITVLETYYKTQKGLESG